MRTGRARPLAVATLAVLLLLCIGLFTGLWEVCRQPVVVAFSFYLPLRSWMGRLQHHSRIA